MDTYHVILAGQVFDKQWHELPDGGGGDLSTKNSDKFEAVCAEDGYRVDVILLQLSDDLKQREPPNREQDSYDIPSIRYSVVLCLRGVAKNKMKRIL